MRKPSARAPYLPNHTHTASKKEANNNKGDLIVKRTVLLACAAGSCTLSGINLAHAQSSVTIYGIVDTYVGYTSNVRSTVAGAPAGSRVELGSVGGLAGSRWGLRGVEDLGGGAKALFNVENGFGPDTGAQADPNRLFNRQAYVGLEGGYGRLMLGRQYTPIFEVNQRFSSQRAAPATDASPNLSPIRTDNMIKYQLETGAANIGIYRSLGEQAGDSSSGAAWGFGIESKLGGFRAGFVYDDANAIATAAGQAESKRALLTAAYTAGDAEFAVGYRWGRDVAATGVTAVRDNLWWTGVRYAFTPATTMVLQYYYRDLRPVGGVNPVNLDQLSGQLIHALSKRTDIYANAAYSRDAGINLTPISTVAVGKTKQAYVGFGVRHRF